MTRATKDLGNGVEWIGYDPADNKSWVVETKGDWTYVCWQENEYGQSIEGYVVKTDKGYHTYNLCKTYDKYFADKDEAIEFVKSKHGVKIKFEFKNGRSIYTEVQA